MKNSRNKIMALILGVACIGTATIPNVMHAATQMSAISTISTAEYTKENGEKVIISVDEEDGVRKISYNKTQPKGLLKLIYNNGDIKYAYSDDGLYLTIGTRRVNGLVYEFKADTGLSDGPITVNKEDIVRKYTILDGKELNITKHEDENGVVSFTLSEKQPVGLMQLKDDETHQTWYGYTEDGTTLYVGIRTVDGKSYKFNPENGLSLGYEGQDVETVIRLEDGNEIIKSNPVNGCSFYQIRAKFKNPVPKGWYKGKELGSNRVSWYYTDNGTDLLLGECYIDNNVYFLNPNSCKLDGDCWVNNNFLANEIIVGKSKYYNRNGIRAKGWIEFDGNWLYLNSEGNIQTGWQKINNKWYYLDKTSGEMKIGWIKDGNTWYYLNDNGSMATGWKKVNGVWYYLDSSGAMKTGWLKDKGKWYYLNSNGSMAKGWVKDRGTWYFMRENGAMKTGWIKVNNKWYFLKNSGAMITRNFRLSGVYYKVASDGSCTW